jgi:hypothetical protein
MAAYMTHTGQQYTLSQRAKSQAAAANEKSYENLEMQLALAESVGNTEIAADIKAEMIRHPSLTAERVRDLQQNRTSNPEGISTLKSMVRDGLITSREQLRQYARDYKVYFDDGELGKIVNTYDSLYATQNGTYVKAKLRQAANIPEGMVVVDKDSDYAKKYAQYEDELVAAQREALQKGEPFDAKSTVDKIASDAIQARNSVDAKVAKDQLAAYEERIGNRSITLANFEALKYRVESGQETRITKSQLNVIKDLLRQIEGLE